MTDTRAQKQALDRIGQVIREGLRVATDPALRQTFPSLPRAPVRLICCPLDKTINHGNILRLADNLRIEQVCFAPCPRKERDFSGCMAALPWVPVAWLDPSEAVAHAKQDGYRIYGLALREDATPLRAVQWTHPCALLLGRELEGLDGPLLPLCDQFVAIPLYGLVPSMNVAVSAGLALEACIAAYAASNPEFRPARATSDNLLHKNAERPQEGS